MPNKSSDQHRLPLSYVLGSMVGGLTLLPQPWSFFIVTGVVALLITFGLRDSGRS